MSKQPAWLGEAGLQKLFADTRALGGEARVVGGAVRDYLMGRAGGDVDLASSLPPDQTMALAEANEWKAIPTGIAHGTVTLVLPERVVEVTTLRRDIETDGRHARVEYTDNFAEDAARRDFTMNALYMDGYGVITDYVGGQQDIAQHRIHFIGNAATRIEEDALRILRFFRFLASHGKAPPDTDALAACDTHKSMIANLSGERIAQEMRKLLATPSPISALEAMAALGLHEYLTESPWHVGNLTVLAEYEREYQLSPNPWLRLVALLAPEFRSETAHWVGERWKLSRQERVALQILASHETELDPAKIKHWLREYPRELVAGRILLAALDSSEALAVAELLSLVKQWEPPVFPLVAHDLLARGYKEGKALGEELKRLERVWAESDYTLEKDALLAQLTSR